MELPYKKRNRVPALCLVCRKRKSKCDRVKPICGLCKKKLISHLCYYETETKDPLPNHVHYVQPLDANGLPPPPLPQVQPLSYQSFTSDNSLPLHSPPLEALPREFLHPMLPPQQAPQRRPLHIAPPLPQPTQRPLPPTGIKREFPALLPLPVLLLPLANSEYTRGVATPTTDLHMFSMSPTQLPAPQAPGSRPGHVTIPLGPTTNLLVSTDDEISVFSHASYSLNTEGPWWAHQGMLLYIGLTKSDPFLKVLRNYTLHLFKAGELNKYMKPQPARLKRKNPQLAQLSVTGFSEAYLPGGRKRARYDLPTGPEKLPQPEEDELQELVITRIAKEEPEPPADDDESDGDPPAGSGPPPKPPQLAKLSPSTRPRTAESSALPAAEVQSFGRSRPEVYQLVLQTVVAILPDKLNLFMLFCRYFKYVHPFVPVLDEKLLLNDVENLFTVFPNFSRERYNEVCIENDNDLVVLGVFLLVIRLGYMSLIHNEHVQYDEDEKSMIRTMRRTSHEGYMRVVQMCVSDQYVASRSLFKLVQALVLLHFYRLAMPSDCLGLGGVDGNILFGTIVRHALCIGLNRDPKFYTAHELILRSQPLIHTWRALWQYIIEEDAVVLIYTGTALQVPLLDISDVQTPTFNDKLGEVNRVLRAIREMCDHYRVIVNMINNVRKPPKVVDLLAETNHLEKLFFQIFGKDYFKDSICKAATVKQGGNEIGTPEHEEAFLKVLKYVVFIHLRTNLLCMYYMIAIHYEHHHERDQLQMETGLGLFKIYVKSVVQLVYIMLYVLDNLVEVFGRNYDYYLTPHNERCMVKTHAFLTLFFVRLLHHRMDLTLKLPKEPLLAPRLEVIDRFFMVILMEQELFIGAFRILSKTYTLSYKVYVMSLVVLKQCLDNPTAFFKGIEDGRFFHLGTNTLDFFTTTEMEHFCLLCEEFRTAKEGNTKTRAAPLFRRDKPLPMAPPNRTNSSNLTTSTFLPLVVQPVPDPGIDLESSQGAFTPITISGDGPGLAGGHLSTASTVGEMGFEENPNVDLMKLFEMYTSMEQHGV